MNTFLKLLHIPVLFILTLGCSKNPADSESNVVGWSLQKSNVVNSLHEVHFINPNTGWAVGGNGLVLHTSNGGSTWKTINTPVTSEFRTVFHSDENTVWVMGSGGNRLFTQDNGANWTVESDGIGLNYKDLQFINNTVGYALGSTGQIIGNQLVKTVDGGETWILKGGIHSALNIFFLDQQRGWVTGTNSRIVRTRDGGDTFETVLAPSGYSFFEKPVFVNDNVGWIIANSCWILGTRDGGQNWNIRVDCGANSGFINDLFFLNENTGWAVGGINSNVDNMSRVLKTTDGGQTWTEEMVTFGIELNSVFFLDQKTGWAVGKNGTILKYRG